MSNNLSQINYCEYKSQLTVYHMVLHQLKLLNLYMDNQLKYVKYNEHM